MCCTNQLPVEADAASGQSVILSGQSLVIFYFSVPPTSLQGRATWGHLLNEKVFESLSWFGLEAQRLGF